MVSAHNSGSSSLVRFEPWLGTWCVFLHGHTTFHSHSASLFTKLYKCVPANLIPCGDRCDEASVPSRGEQNYAWITTNTGKKYWLTKRTSVRVIPCYNLLFYCMISGERGTGMSARFVILIPRMVCQITVI